MGPYPTFSEPVAAGTEESQRYGQIHGRPVNLTLYPLLEPSPFLADASQLNSDLGRRQQPVNTSRLHGTLRHVRLLGRLELLGKHEPAGFLDRFERRRPIGVES